MCVPSVPLTLQLSAVNGVASSLPSTSPLLLSSINPTDCSTAVTGVVPALSWNSVEKSLGSYHRPCTPDLNSPVSSVIARWIGVGCVGAFIAKLICIGCGDTVAGRRSGAGGARSGLERECDRACAAGARPRSIANERSSRIEGISPGSGQEPRREVLVGIAS